MSRRRPRTLPWELGAIARLAGAKANPYGDQTIAGRAWRRGWEHEDRELALERDQKKEA